MTARPAAASRLVAFVLLASLPIAQERPAAQPPVPPKPEPRTEWPKLKEADRDRAIAIVGQFKKPEQKLHEPARQQLIGMGEAVVPVLLQQVSDRADNVNSHLFAIFDAVLGQQHSTLMAREAMKPRVELRRYLTMRLCRFNDSTLVPFFDSLLKDADEQTVFYSRLALLAQKRRDVLPGVLATAKQRWAEVAPMIAEVLPQERSLECGNWVFESIAKAGAADQMTGLRLLRSLAVREHGLVLRAYLDAPDHTVKREAINAARALHGEPPIENLAVFQAIEMAKEWKNKL